jgi:peptidoglycan/LPS O-acetylase OafA/YrhL
LSKNLSVFLDLLRLFAALLVLVGHAGEVYHMHLPDIIAHSAKEGVAIFFVLSGFVIAFVTANKERHWRDFARARALRMYSVVPLAITVMLACLAVGSIANPELYGYGHSGTAPNGGAIGEAPGWFSVLRYLTFTNELWFDRAVIRTGAPFWSLGFEVAYYVAFAVLFYARGYWRWGLALLWLMVCGPRVALAFPLWLVGVGAWNLMRKWPRTRGAMGWAILAIVVSLGLAWRKWAGSAAWPLFEWPTPGAVAPSMIYYLVLGGLVALAIVVFEATAPERSIWPRVVERAVRYCAGASFTLYIAHLPVMVLIAALWPASSGSTLCGLIATAITTGAMFALAELGERRKAAYARIFSYSSRGFLRKNRLSLTD